MGRRSSTRRPRQSPLCHPRQDLQVREWNPHHRPPLRNSSGEDPASNWRAYHKWFTDAGLSGENYIQLTNTPLVGNSSAQQTSGTDTNNSTAANLIYLAGQDIQRHDRSAARTKLDVAREANPKQPYLWSAYGNLALLDEKPEEAVADLKKEFAAYPNESNVYSQLIAVLMQQRKPEDAIAVLQTLVDRNPADESGVLYLALIHTELDDNPSAEKVLRAGIAAKPDSSLRMRLGMVLLHEQKTAEGEALLVTILSASEDPEQINDAAYELANASLDLPLAEKSPRHSLDLLDLATNNGETGPKASFRANLLIDSWDTLGWILYREGKVSEAEPWIRAAWRNSNTAEPGYHLAILLEKENHPTDALAQLDLAASSESKTDAPGVANLISDERSSLLQSGTPLPSADARIELQHQRTHELGQQKLKTTGEGWATIELELTPQGTTAFRIVQGDQSLQPLSDTIQHLNLDLQLPPQNHAKLLRRGVVSCHTGSPCQLVLIPQNTQNP